MILFLFEYKERKLYGVFEASSDGAMNISPYAFSSSGKSFSAQIRFRKIWSCHPLCEDEFYDAIKDNYYMPNKFNFYLSKEQVSKLIQLFSTRKIKIQRSPSLGAGNKFIKRSEHSGLGRVRVTAKGRSSDDVGDELELYDGVESVCLSRHPDLSKHNQNHSAYYDNLIVNMENVVDEGEQGLTLTVPRSTKLHTSDIIRSKSHRDGTVMDNHSGSPPDDHLCHPLHLQHNFSSGMMQNSTSTQEFIAQPSWHQNLDVSTNNQTSRALHLSDSYEPSRYHISSPGSGYYENESIDSTNLEAAYKAITFPKGYDPSSATISFSRAASFGKKILDSPSLVQSSAQVPMHMHDYIYPAASQHEDDREGRQDWYNESSATTASLAKAENFGKEIMDSSHFLSSEGKDLSHLSHFISGEGKDLSHSYEHSSPTYHDVEYHPSSRTSSLHSDMYNKRTSVFSRLSIAPEASLQEEEGYESDTGISVNELLEQLSLRRKCWRKDIKKSKQLFPWNDEKHSESEPQVDISGLISSIGDEDDFWSNDEIVGERPKSPFLNFKRRSEVRKIKSETETTICAEGRKSECYPVKRKRRKLIRPSLSKEESFGQGSSECHDVKESCQEICGNQASVTDSELKGNGESSVISVRNVDSKDAFDGDMKESSQQIYRSQESVIDAESKGIVESSDLSVRNEDSKDAFDGDMKESSQQIYRRQESVIDAESNGIDESSDLSVRNVDSKDAFVDDVKESSKEIDRNQVSVIDAERKGIGDSSESSIRNLDFIPLEVNSPKSEGLS